MVLTMSNLMNTENKDTIFYFEQSIKNKALIRI